MTAVEIRSIGLREAICTMESHYPFKLAAKAYNPYGAFHFSDPSNAAKTSHDLQYNYDETLQPTSCHNAFVTNNLEMSFSGE